MAQKAKAPRTAPAKKDSRKRVKPGQSKGAVDARQALFVDEYIQNGGNGTRAAIAAGYAEAGAHVQASRMLRNAKVAEALRARREQIARRYELTTDRVLAECGRVAFSRLSDVYHQDGRLRNPMEMSDHALAAVAAIEVVEESGGDKEDVPRYVKKVKLWDKNAAIERLMRHMGLFEKDNRQKVDPIAQLMQHIAEHDTGLPVRA